MKKLSILFAALLLMTALTATARQGGGGGGATETIKVSKCEYADVGGYVELLVKASSSNTSAHLYAYLPSGGYLGEVQNGGGSRYGGTVLLTYSVPASLTIVSSSGAVKVAPCTPFQP
jgi:hypothetical protein